MEDKRRSGQVPYRDDIDGPASVTVPIVGVGASAGGIQALQRFFGLLPSDLGAAFVVVVHLDPHTPSELSQILQTQTRMPVEQIAGRTSLRKDHVYIIPPDKQLCVTDHEIFPVPFSEPRGQRTPIDLFFRSLAHQHGDAFVVVLTGAGSDGASGVKAVKEAGGIVLVQHPDEAEHPSMPRAAIATAAVDFVLPLHRLADQLVALIRTRRTLLSQSLGNEDEFVRRVLAHVRVKTGHDFAQYKRSTVMRRILRRMQVARKESVEEYFSFLRENADEAHALLSDLLISVTTFFRDPKVFEALSKYVVPNLFHERTAADTIRVWVPGCASGEEAYSIAILLLEEASRREFRPEIQIFGSDMDEKAINVAREGRYPASIESDLSEERLRRFFVQDREHYRITRELRDTLLFSHHSILRDPPFSRLDFISCRNLLIYLDRDLQQQVLITLHYGLRPGGYLLLGASESAETPEGLFHSLDRDSRLYQAEGRSTDWLPTLPRVFGTVGGNERQTSSAGVVPARTALAAHRAALEASAPASALVDSSYRIVHLSETAGRYLQPPAGPMTSEITELVRPEMKFELRAALHRAFEDGKASLSPAIYVQFNGLPVRSYIQVKPVASPDGEQGAQRALVFFIEAANDSGAIVHHDAEGQQASADAVEQLRRELEQTQSRLRTTREESESATEELRAANEELQSINEEYRSTAEELETSKEELQSINEELQTVNSELKQKLESVSRANSDLQNLMAVADIATLFLGPTLRINRFTPKLADLFSITPNDVGRPITDFTHQLEYDNLIADARNVLHDLTPSEHEIKSRTGGWYLVRFRPYRTVDDKIDGVVATFVDITERKKMEDALRTSEATLRREKLLVEQSRTPIFIWDFDGRILQWNRGSEELYGYSKGEALGKSKEALLNPMIPGSSFAEMKKELAEKGVWKGELYQTTKDNRQVVVDCEISLLTMDGRRYALESARDVTQAKAWEKRQRLLLGELTHRVKNTLAVVQSMAHQTWRTSKSREDFIQRLDGRIAALASAHMLLVDSEWKGADLRALISSQLAPYTVESPGRIHLNGGPVALSAEASTPFGLVLHELATNAAKYGALSNEKGEIELSWAVDSRNEKSILRIIWQERNGPKVDAAQPAGFGSNLIRKGVPNSAVKYELLPEGVRCVIEMTMGGGADDGMGK
jgi:two-component system, chemotaxis family, CheB/CheR fusion protein